MSSSKIAVLPPINGSPGIAFPGLKKKHLQLFLMLSHARFTLHSAVRLLYGIGLTANGVARKTAGI